MIIALYVIAYVLIGCVLAVVGLRRDHIAKTDENMVFMTIFVWPFVLLIVCLQLLVETVVKIGKPK